MTHIRQAVSTITRHIRSSGIESKTRPFRHTGTPTCRVRTKTTETTKLTSLQQYNDEKKSAKQRRTERYEARMTRKAGLNSRQDPKKKNFKKNQFRQWFDAMASKQAYLDREARRQGKQWKINVAAMIERLPVVTPDRPQWELDYLHLKAELDRYDNIAYPKELGLQDPMDHKVLTDEELFALMPEGFKPAPRETEADKSGDVQTLNRRLKTRVYLSVCEDEDQGWNLPTVGLHENETFLAGAKRAVKTVAGKDLELLCLSNCPMGVDVVEYSDEDKKKNDGFFGEKTFYMRVQYEDGDVKKNKISKMKDWGWLTREEMVEKAEGDKRDETATFYKYML